MSLESIEKIGVILLFVFGISMFYQGTMILKGHHGYHPIDEKRRLERMKNRLEKLFKEFNKDD